MRRGFLAGWLCVFILLTGSLAALGFVYLFQDSAIPQRHVVTGDKHTPPVKSAIAPVQEEKQKDEAPASHKPQESKSAYVEAWVAGERQYILKQQQRTQSPVQPPAQPVKKPEASSAPKPAVEQAAQPPVSGQPQKPPPVYRKPAYYGNRSEPAISLTFDDGYGRKYIERVLTVLAQKNVKCDFFIVGDALKAYADVWKRAVKEGHSIHNHTQDHIHLTELSTDEIRRQVQGWEEIAIQVLGQEYVDTMKKEAPYIRFPGGAGHNSPRVLTTVEELGYQPVAWTEETWHSVLRHYNLKTADVGQVSALISDHMISQSEKGKILLLHFNAFDVERLDTIIDGIRSKGLEFKQLKDFLQ